LKLHNWHWLP